MYWINNPRAAGKWWSYSLRVEHANSYSPYKTSKLQNIKQDTGLEQTVHKTRNLEREESLQFTFTRKPKGVKQFGKARYT
jgi:hypothetical protein